MKKYSARYPLDLPAWASLKAHARDLKPLATSKLFAQDKKRAERFSMRVADLLLDVSRQRIKPRTLQLLTQLAKQADVVGARDRMIAGQAINSTEGRAVLHMALRGNSRDAFSVDGVLVSSEVRRVRRDMLRFVDAVHDGAIVGATGQPFSDVINIGIGGSDLGIVMATRALAHVATGLNVHTVSNVDGTQLADLMAALDPARTLVVVCSKTFTTLETMTNANAARAWIKSRLGEGAVRAHFAAASTNHPAMDAFDINPDRRFGFWDWVGGRYSLWSAVGLSIALGIGSDQFKQLLAGARKMDQHFATAPVQENAPMLLALLGIWNSNFLGATSQAILPYDNRLDRFPAYLQQLQMESSGKRVRHDGRAVRADTGRVIWGEAGSNAQHSFYQLLHQGTDIIPADFILPVRSSGATQHAQDLAIANCLAQADALMQGFSESQARKDLLARGLSNRQAAALAQHKVHEGNRPSTVIMMRALTALALGQLIALYEHKVFVEGIVWGINSFDQWGVELGKKLAKSLEPAVADPRQAHDANASTQRLLQQAKRWRKP
ncbi:MAG: glucose-6-phosphate isomerase [Pseudomonadota bacterium]